MRKIWQAEGNKDSNNALWPSHISKRELGGRSMGRLERVARMRMDWRRIGRWRQGLKGNVDGVPKGLEGKLGKE